MAKTSRQQTLMVALRTTDAAAKPLLRKALDLADRFDARLRLLHVVDPTYGFVRSDLKRESKKLHDLVDNRRARTDVDVTTSIVRDHPIADAIVRQVLRHAPDMLVAESHRHGKLSRVLMGQTDWELIRNCPCPLWLSKSGRLPRQLKVLAAVDPFHSRAKPTKLDDVIMRTALNIAGNRHEQVIACHGYTPPMTVVPVMTGELYWQPLSEKELRQYEASVRKTIDRRLARYQFPSRNRLAVPGDPATTLVRMARKHHVGVIVMGAVSRSALKRFFIGNTAERVIDEVECDLLVVKSANFRTPVPRRRTGFVLGYPVASRAGPAVSTPLHY